jgi:hypothetical protein
MAGVMGSQFPANDLHLSDRTIFYKKNSAIEIIVVKT